MASSLRSIIFFLILLAVLSSSILSVTQARPLHSLSPTDNVIKDVINGISRRTLKGSGPSSGIGHRLKMLQNVEVIKISGPSPGIGHRLRSLENNIGVVKDSGPSTGIGHKYITGKQS